jgi:hypothetical protein
LCRHGQVKSCCAAPDRRRAAGRRRNPQRRPEGEDGGVKDGDIPNAGMGPMTMSFPVKDPAALAKLSPGDKVQFTAEKVGDQIVFRSNAPAK